MARKTYRFRDTGAVPCCLEHQAGVDNPVVVGATGTVDWEFDEESLEDVIECLEEHGYEYVGEVE
jgi:hypothetical protein